MAKDLKEQIEIMTHYLNGGEIEFSDDKFKTLLGEANKEDDGELCWNWDEFDYRIKEPKQTVTIEKWLISYEDDIYQVLTGSTNFFKKNIHPQAKIKLLKSYEIELEGE